MTISKCKLIDLPTYFDQRGSLTCIEGALDIPFEIKRVYYLYGSDCHQERGMHAHKRLGNYLFRCVVSLTSLLMTASKKNVSRWITPQLDYSLIAIFGEK